MKLRKAIKKIVAISAGLSMVGATIFGAAADLGDYPSPFIANGAFDGVLVVGDTAKADDVIGATDIAMSLQYSAKTVTTSTTTATTSVTGDAWRVGTSSKHLEMSENLDSGNTNEEKISDIQTSIDEDELAALADGEILNDKGTAGYNQYLNFEDTVSNDTSIVKYVTDSDTDVTADFFYVKSGKQIARYSLEFKSNLQSDVEDSTGTNTANGLYLGDIEDETITMLGKSYEIVKARRTTSTGGGVELTLMGGAVKDTLQEGETKTYTVNGVDYEVTLVLVTDTGTIQAKLSVNGETTKALTDGSTYRLKDGTEIGISELLPNEAGDVTQDIAEFYLGASKVFLKDTIINGTNTVSSNNLEVGNNKISDAPVIITGTDDNSVVGISTIQINVTSADDFYVPAGGKLSEQMDEPEPLSGLGWDIEYKGLDSSIKTEQIRIKPSGSNKYRLYFSDGDGVETYAPICYVASGGSTCVKFGDDNDDLILWENVSIDKNDYFVVRDTTPDTATSKGKKSYVLRYMGADKIGDDNPVIKFDLIGHSPARIEKTLTNATGTNADAEIKLGGATFRVFVETGQEGAKDGQIKINLDADTSYNEGTTIPGRWSDENTTFIVTNYGAQINIKNLSTETGGHVEINITTPDSDDYEDKKPTALLFDILGASGEGNINEDNVSVINYLQPEDEENINYAYTTMGAKIKWENPTSDPDTITIEYPESQRLPLVYVTAGVVTTALTEGGTSEQVVIQQIEVGAAKLASEVADIKAQNAIVIGGPCANAAAAELMGNPEECWTAVGDAGLLKLYTNDGNTALLAAGKTAMDTRRASRVIANYGDYALSGDEMTVSGTSLTDITVAAAEEAAATE